MGLQYTKVGQPNINNQKVMCQQSMKFSGIFDHNTPHTFDKIREKHSNEKCSHSLTLSAKVKVITATIKSQCPREQKTCLTK